MWPAPVASRSLLTMRSFRAFGQRFAKLHRAAAILILNALLLFAGLEFVAMGAIMGRRFMMTPEPPLVGEGAPRETVSYYESQDWGQLYWHEFRLARKQRYYPYVAWRRAPFRGKTINIDEHGVRLTPGADCTGGSYKVFAFGGSTMWGTGSPDWGTIAARLQAGLEKRRPGSVCVTNFGETGYVTTQSVVMLLMQLKLGNIPNAVVFYAGPNDIYAAYQSGRADVHENFDQIAAQFEGRRAPVPWFDRLRNTYSYSIVDSLVDKLTTGKPKSPVKVLNYETAGIDASTLSDLVVKDYLGDREIIDVLAKRYGFEAFMFIQPILSMGNKPLTREEQQMKETFERDKALDKLATAVYRTLDRESSKYERLYYLAHIFDGNPDSLWIDPSHVNPVGNDLIAQRVVEVIMTRPSPATAADLSR
jgi:lysophospholipase L1-like esterase